jgi:hypothetical protein
MTERYWVIGGDYTAMDFRALDTERAAIVGPFDNREEAQAAWRRLSSENSSRATTRFSIAAEQFARRA